MVMGGHDHPEVMLHTLSLGEYERRLGRGELVGGGDLMVESAEKLGAAGAEFLICPDNTIHQAFGYVVARSTLPWLHIAEVVAQEAVRRGMRRVGITGTRWLVESGVYPEKLEALGVGWVRPSVEEMLGIDRIIFEELVEGVFTARAVGYFQGVMEGMKDAGCDGVVLGCTEIPLLMDEGNSPLPVLDSTRLLARAAVRRALE
jgi:aspartate racemase